MPDIEKVMGVGATDIEKIMGVAAGDIEKVTGVTLSLGTLVWHGDRAVGYGGYTGSASVNVIQYKAVTSSGDTSDFGDVSAGTSMYASGLGDSSRGVFALSVLDASDYSSNIIEYVTVGSTGDATDFGDLSVARGYCASTTNGITGVFAGGYEGSNPRSDVIDYITISTTSNASDFGDLPEGGSSLAGVCNTVRGVFGGGYNTVTSPNQKEEIEYVTIASVGDASDFGDLTDDKHALCAVESGTRGVFWSGRTSNSNSDQVNIIDYITVDTTGNASDFGDQDTLCDWSTNGMGNLTRGERWGGVQTDNVKTDAIQYITIASTGNSTDAGNLLGEYTYGPGGCSGT